MRSQNATANINSKSRTNPIVYTEQGTYMLATVLKNEIAVTQSIGIMRAFRQMRIQYALLCGNDCGRDQILCADDPVQGTDVCEYSCKHDLCDGSFPAPFSTEQDESGNTEDSVRATLI